jgi:flagellar biogenesis protein FliO
MIGAYLQMAMALIAVIGLIAVTGYFLRKRQGKSSLMNVLAYQSFGPRKGIAALKIGPEILLVGVTSTDIKLLKAFSEHELEPEFAKEIDRKLHKLRTIKKRLNEQ